MIGRIVCALFLCGYLAVIVPFTTAVAHRPLAVKLGTMPSPEVLRPLSGGNRQFIAQYAVVKVLFYYGTLVEKFREKIYLKPEYENMFDTLQTAAKLDPWNSDVYYFTQAAFTWELRRIDEVNRLLEFGMRYRTWDYQLPFFLGFNNAYFRKDYAAAAPYFEKAAKLSHDPLMVNLSARYFSESGQNEMALRFIEFMQRRTTDRKMIALYEIRKQALIGALTVQKGAEEYRRRFGTPPARVSDLVAKGVLKSIPRDPYGGEYYLDEKGVVRSTSKFARPSTPPQQKGGVPSRRMD
ncbi:hypothetical protein LPW11_17680 [Geomonas sp. RF6]|uniref:hypothetical protein n=1 Tax=Geomonas sp. RF6 TaxID=2897342 RepID=UPI001E30945A|nr:hypothetical protein [Geomonas sp. RF6]UFS69713.1 hypothetical protein LPW11_17680 [Geomonas sp. RF6]